MNSHKYKFAFFGTPEISTIILSRLKECGFLPSLIIAAPDRPKGRGLELTPPETKVWATQNEIEIFQPEKLNDESYKLLQEKGPFDFFLIVAYGKIIPQRFLDIPKMGSINVHPSLLPKYRGPSPLQSQILNGDLVVGTTIMKMDAEMDHGPIISQRSVTLNSPESFPLFMARMANLSGELLCETLPKYLNGDLKPEDQDHSEATVCKMIKKEDGQIVLNDNPKKNYLKYLAYTPWPGTFFFTDKSGKPQRVKITDAEYRDNNFVIKKVIPEGRKEMGFEDFSRTHQ